MNPARGQRTRPGRPGLWGWLRLRLALRRIAAWKRQGADLAVVAEGSAYLRRWKGNARIHSEMAGAYWGLSLWRDSIQHGRRALTLEPRRLQAVTFVLAAYRSLDAARGIAFGEAWLARHGVHASVCRHLSFLYDDLGDPAKALAVARCGLVHEPGNRRLAACTANYLAKVEGAASALQFVGSHRHLLAGDTYCENTLARGMIAAGAFVDAAVIFDRMHRREPRDATILSSLLDAWFRCARYRDVVTAVEGWRERYPLSATLANEAGRACLELDRHDEAMTWFDRAVQLAPDSAKFADNRAIALGRAGRHAESIEAARQRLQAPDADRLRLLKSIASNHTRLGEHARALPLYRQVFQEFPDDGDALVDVMVGLNWLNEYAEAAAFGNGYRESRASRLPARYWSELAWAQHQTGRFDEEEMTAREWARLHPDDVAVVRVCKRACNRLERRNEALAFARAWVEAHPESGWGWRYLAEQYEACGDAEAERAAIAEACHLAPDDDDFIDTRLTILRRHGRPQEAFELGRDWIAAHPTAGSASLFNRIGLAADDLERWPAAEAHYQRAHELEPAHGTWAGNLLRTWIHQDRAPEAIAVGRRWLEEHGWDDYVANKLAWALRQAGELAEETAVLRRLAEAEASDSGLNHALLTNLVARKCTEKARAWLDSCAARGTATSGMWNDWANHLRELDVFPEAEAAYHRALEAGPDNDVAAGNLAAFLVARERAGEAAGMCRAWLERRPDDHYVRRQLANAWYSDDNYATAEPAYRALHVREPDSLFLLERWVACLRLLGRNEEALAAAAAWLQKHDGSAFLEVERGIAAFRLGRLDEALARYEAALALDPASTAAASRKLRILGEQGRLDRAFDFGEQWITGHPAAADADFHNELAILQDRAGRTDDAERNFLRAVELAPQNPTFAGNAVEILARRERFAESLQLGQRCLASNPPNAYLLRRLAEAYGDHHEHAAALDLIASADVLEPADPSVAGSFLRLASEGDELERGIEFGRGWLARPGNETCASVWARFSRLCFRADHDDEAFAAVGRAIALEPDEIAHVRLRFAFWNALRNSHTMLSEFGDVRAEWREDAQLLQYTSRACRELGLEAEALRLAERNLAANPADDAACAWLADLHDHSGRIEDARACLRGWIGIHGEQPAVLKSRARLALRDKHYAEALADAEKVLGRMRSDEESFIVGIRALRGLGRRPEAQARLHHWLEHHGSSSRIERLLDEKTDEEMF